MFTVFDKATGKPLIIHLTDKVKSGEEIVVSEQALIICRTSAAAKQVLRELFGGIAVQITDPATGKTVDRYQIRHSQGNGRVALAKLVEITGVEEFWDGKKLGQYEKREN